MEFIFILIFMLCLLLVSKLIGESFWFFNSSIFSKYLILINNYLNYIFIVIGNVFGFLIYKSKKFSNFFYCTNFLIFPIDKSILSIIFLFLFLLIISYYLGKQSWFLELKFIKFLLVRLKNLLELNLVFILILLIITFFLCCFLLFLLLDYYFSGDQNLFGGIFLLIFSIIESKFINYILINIFVGFIFLNFICLIWVYKLFNNLKFFNYIFIFYNFIILIYLLKLFCLIYDITFINNAFAMMNGNGDFIDSLDVSQSFNNLKKIDSSEILDKDLYNKTINSNLIVQSNKNFEFGICYKNIDDVRELYKNSSYIVRTLCDNGLNLFGNGELIKNDQNEVVHCFFAKKK